MGRTSRERHGRREHPGNRSVAFDTETATNAANRDCAHPVFAALRASTPLTHVFVGSRRVVVT
jgi:hypothetical protein